MNKVKFILILVVLCFLSAGNIYSQGDKDIFNLDALNFYSPDSTRTRLDVYIEFPLDKLQFKKSKDNKDQFSTKVNITIEIKDDLGIKVVNKDYREEITTSRTESDYVSQNSRIITKYYFLQPGHYKLKVTVDELNSKNSSTTERDLTIRDFLAQPITISDIMIVSKYQLTNNQKNITPCINRNVSDLDTFYIFFFVYKNNEDSKIELSCSVHDSKKNLIYGTKETLDITTGIDLQNQVILKIPLSNLQYDNYTIDISAVASQFTSNITASFVCVNTAFPMSLKNIDLLISQLQYIANDHEMTFMQDAKTDEEKRKRFLDFWKSKDPSPGTKRNELLNEYYKRLNYADKHFSTPYSDGWKSDMGMVYVIFGMPNNVDRHPYEMNSKPYEVWDYYNVNRQFVFVDETGFGDYRLITPIYDDRFKLN